MSRCSAVNLAFLAFVVLACFVVVPEALAAEATSDTCTTDFKEDWQDGETGLITQIITYIKEIIDSATEDLFNGIINNSGFINAVNVALTLMVTFFGVAFMFGIVPLTLGQALTRGFKLAVIAALLNEGFGFFDDYVIRLFNDGTDDLINGIVGIATGDASATTSNASGSPQPFRKLDEVAMQALSPQMMTTMIGSFTTGPMGLGVGGLLAMGVLAFIQAVVKALKVYCLSLVAKALLFGMAPIFISFILFERTKHIFTGWLNQLVNYSLQPILMFAFISFFIVLMEGALANILRIELCWTGFDQSSGTSETTQMWRFVDKDGNITQSDFNWDGLVSCLQGGAEGTVGAGQDCPDFPINILDVLTFLILAHLAWRFSDVVVAIATEIASSTLFLDKLRSGMADAVHASQVSGAGGDPTRNPSRSSS